MLQKIVTNMRVLDASLRSTYGDGIGRYFKFVYISFLRINTYEVLCVETAGYDAPAGDADLQSWDLPRLRAYREGKNLPREFYMDLAKDLQRPWVILQGSEVVYITWEMEERSSRFLTHGQGDVELSYSLTMPAHRRKGLHRRAFAQLIPRLRQRGCKRVFAVVHNENVNSLASLRAIGMQTRAKIVGVGRLIRKLNTARVQDGVSGCN